MTLYAEAADLVPYAMTASAASAISLDDKTAACTAASDEASAEFARVFTLPLTAWGADVTRAVAVIAGYELLSSYGFDSADEGSSYRRRADAARAWLKRIGDGELVPPGIVDSSPGPTAEDIAFVITNARRGW